MIIISILNTVKKILSIEEDDDSFDLEIITGIQAAMLALSQLGIDTVNGFDVDSADDTWEACFGDLSDLIGLKQYVALKTKLVFDPPQNSFTTKALQDSVAELEWRLTLQVERRSGGELDV